MNYINNQIQFYFSRLSAFICGSHLDYFFLELSCYLLVFLLLILHLLKLSFSQCSHFYALLKFFHALGYGHYCANLLDFLYYFNTYSIACENDDHHLCYLYCSSYNFLIHFLAFNFNFHI